MILPGRDRTVCRMLLTLSLGLNLFLIGWVVTGSLGADYAKPDPAPEAVAAEIAAALPQPDSDLLLRAVAAQRQALLEARRNYLAAFNHLRSVVAAEPLDATDLRRAVADLRTARQSERALFGDTIVEVLPRMSREGRQAFVASHLGGRQ
jgi:uncharacterized membrane protein